MVAQYTYLSLFKEYAKKLLIITKTLSKGKIRKEGFMNKKSILIAMILAPGITYADPVPSTITVNIANNSSHEYRSIIVDDARLTYTAVPQTPLCPQGVAISFPPVKVTKGIGVEYKLSMDSQVQSCLAQGADLNAVLMITSVDGKKGYGCFNNALKTPDGQYAVALQINEGEDSFSCSSGASKK